MDQDRFDQQVGDGVGVLTVRYWAGARAAAGVPADELPVPTPATVGALAEVLVSRQAALGPVLAVASILVNGLTSAPEAAVAAGDLVEVLPPFAGG